MLIHLTQTDIDAADRDTSPVAVAIARALGVNYVSLRTGDPPDERKHEYWGWWLHWRGGPYYLPYRAQIICFAWRYGPGATHMKCVRKGVLEMVPWGDIVRPCKFEIEGLEK
jgi:hypothetical protein